MLLVFAHDVLEKGEKIQAFNNIYNSPTFVGDLIRSIEIIATKKMEGIFHLAGASRENRYDFLRLFAKENGFQEELIKPSLYISVKDAPRPLDISLDSKSSYERIGFIFHDARSGLHTARGYH